MRRTFRCIYGRFRGNPTGLGTLLCALAKKYTYIGYMGSVEMCEGVRSDRE